MSMVTISRSRASIDAVAALDLAVEPGGPVHLFEPRPVQRQQVRDPGADLEGLEGLGQEVGGAGFQGFAAQGALVHARHHDDRHVCEARHLPRRLDESTPFISGIS